MGRLVDTNDVYNVLTDYYHHKTATQHMALKDALDKVETVDAIPVEWINDHVAWLESMDADVAGSDARAIKVMLIKWKMEQETAGGCSADACPIKF